MKAKKKGKEKRAKAERASSKAVSEARAVCDAVIERLRGPRVAGGVADPDASARAPPVADLRGGAEDLAAVLAQVPVMVRRQDRGCLRVVAVLARAVAVLAPILQDHWPPLVASVADNAARALLALAATPSLHKVGRSDHVLVLASLCWL